MAYFNEELISSVWSEAESVAGYDPNIWRKDFAGAWIRRDHYGKQEKYGWEIDHLKPVSAGGSDDLQNLIAMHWRNNRAKSDHYPDFTSVLTSQGNTNIEQTRSWAVNV